MFHTWSMYNAAPLGLIGHPTKWPQAAKSGSLGGLKIHNLPQTCAPWRPPGRFCDKKVWFLGKRNVTLGPFHGDTPRVGSESQCGEQEKPGKQREPPLNGNRRKGDTEISMISSCKCKNCVSSSFVEPPEPTRHKREILVLLYGSDGAEKSLTSRRSGDPPITRRKSGRRGWAELDRNSVGSHVTHQKQPPALTSLASFRRGTSRTTRLDYALPNRM